MAGRTTLKYRFSGSFRFSGAHNKNKSFYVSENDEEGA